MRCDGCGNALRPRARFCDECGARQRVDAAADVDREERNPLSYTPRHLADEILRSKSAMEGERKQVTILFADVKGSMELAQQLDPERWHQILDRFFGILAAGVHRFEGTVNQYTGDGIMALFGAPLAHEDHPQRACYAALYMRDALRTYAQQLRRDEGLDFAVRIGLNSGEVVVGKIGDDLRMDYTAQGHSVGLAQRMEQLAEAGRIYVADSTARQVAGYFELEDLGEFNLRGVDAPISVYELLGTGAVQTRLDLARTRGLSKFVGRGGEIEMLRSALDRARSGNGQVVGVMGEAGSGKSRLCFEFAERCRAQGIAVFEANAVAHAQSTPFLPVLKLLRDSCGVEERDSDQSSRDKIAGRILRLDPALTRALPLLFDLLGLADLGQPAPNLEPEVREKEISKVVRAVLHAPIEHGNAVLLIEDLHWLDRASAAFLKDLIDAIPGTGTLIVLNFRPEFSAEWNQHPCYQQISLRPLASADLAELLEALLGSHPSLGELPERIRARSGGNPFFVEEAVRSLVERGQLAGVPGAYECVETVEKLDVPESVQALLAARIDRLPEHQKRVLQNCAVIGSVFTRALLGEICELPEVELDSILHSLVAAEFLFEEALFPDRVYAFKHALTREVAYDTQLAAKRSHIHADVARAIEASMSGDGDELAGLLAHHWSGADRPLESARWHRRAAIWSGMAHQQQSIQHWLRVLELCNPLEETEETLALGIEARAQLLTPIGVAEFSTEAEQLFSEAREMARRSRDPGAETRVLGSYGAFRLRQGAPADSVAMLREAVRVADQSPDKSLLGGLVPFLTIALGETGPLSEAITLVENADSLYRDVPHAGIVELGLSPLAPGKSFHGMWLGLSGNVEAGRRQIESARKLALEADDSMSLAVIETNAAHLEIEVGDGQAALRLSRRIEELGLMTQSLMPAAALASAGKWREAENAFDALWEKGSTQYQLTWGPMRALTLYELGFTDAALSILGDCAAHAEAGGARICELRARCMLAHLLIRNRGLEAIQEIDAALTRAASLIEITQATLFQPRLCLERAALARLRGDAKQRTRELLEAKTLFEQMGAPAQAERIDPNAP